MINTAITMAVATAIVRKADKNFLSENGGPITITSNWAKLLLYRMNFVKRRGSSTAKMTVTNFEVVKEQFVLDVNAVVEMDDISPELVLNWDQTGFSVVSGSSWTMEVKASKQVEIVGISDKRQITAFLCGAMTGEFLPPQLIYQGKTLACLLRYNFPDDWHVTCTSNHWSNENKMMSSSSYRMWIANARSSSSHLINLHWPFLMCLKASKRKTSPNCWMRTTFML